MEIDRRISTLASRQHSLVTLTQLAELGLNTRTIGYRVEQGRLERLHRGVFRTAGAVMTNEQMALAACLAVGGLVAASHRCAAALWGLDLPLESPVEVTVLGHRAPSPRGIVVHRSVDLTEADLTVRGGVPVTKPYRLLVDLGAVVTQAVVGNCLDDLVGRKVLTVAGVEAGLDRLGEHGRSGAGVLRAELERRQGAGPMGRTRLEALLFDLAQRAGLPSLVFQHPIRLGGRARRIDFAFPELRIAIEVDGYETHSRYDVFEDDRVRGNELELAGWTVLRFTWHQLRHRQDYVAGVLRRALSQAA
jgi:very-short-patch-repair endonuclease